MLIIKGNDGLGLYLYVCGLSLSRRAVTFQMETLSSDKAMFVGMLHGDYSKYLID